MAFFKRSQRPTVHDPMVILGGGGNLPPKGDLLNLDGNIVPVSLAQQEIPATSIALTELALEYLGKPGTEANVIAASQMANMMLSVVSKSTLEGFAKKPDASLEAERQLMSDDGLSLSWVRSVADEVPQGGFLWDYQVIRVFSLLTQPGGGLDQL